MTNEQAFDTSDYDIYGTKSYFDVRYLHTSLMNSTKMICHIWNRNCNTECKNSLKEMYYKDCDGLVI